MKFFLKTFLAVFLFLTISHFCHQQTDGFQLVKVVSHLPPAEEWETASCPILDEEKLKIILSQPFSYLASGGQCYAFISEDKSLVLKLFKMHHLRQYPLLYRLRFPGMLDTWRIKFLHFQKQKLQRVFSSSHLAYTKLKDETGLLHLKLNSIPSSELEVLLIDKIGIAHRLNLAEVPFALQYRADNPFKMLRLHLLHKDFVAAKEVIREIFECLTARYEKGIRDLDPALRRNIGLLKNRAIAIDIGSFFPATSPISNEEKKQELFNDTRRMRRWLQKRSLELTGYLDHLIANYPNDAGVSNQSTRKNKQQH